MARTSFKDRFEQKAKGTVALAEHPDLLENAALITAHLSPDHEVRLWRADAIHPRILLMALEEPVLTPEAKTRLIQAFETAEFEGYPIVTAVRKEYEKVAREQKAGVDSNRLNTALGLGIALDWQRVLTKAHRLNVTLNQKAEASVAPAAGPVEQ